MTYEEVKKLAENNGYILISTEYTNSKSKLIVKRDGFYGLVDIDALRRKDIFSPWSKINPYSIQNIKTYLLQRNSEATLLDTEYKNNKQKLKFRCKCGRTFYRCMSDMPSTIYIECRECTIERRARKRRTCFEEVEKEFTNNGYKILSGEYKNLDSRFEVENSEGYRGTLSLRSVKNGNVLNAFAPIFAQNWYVYNLNKWLKDSGRKVEVLDHEKDIKEFSTRILTCRCPICNKVFNTPIATLRSGKDCCDDCGNVYSGYSIKVENWLKDNHVDYIREKRFPDCIDVQELPFDFYLPEFNACIEVDGEGHYKPVQFRGASLAKTKHSFKQTQRHDKMKDEYCLVNKIKLVRIPYWDLQNENYKEILANIVKS